MSDHIERMKDEHKELVEKQTKLNSFIHSNAVFKTLCDLEQAQMIKQSGFMGAYAMVLEQRIWTAIKT
jgi:hypothetical protein